MLKKNDYVIFSINKEKPGPIYKVLTDEYAFKNIGRKVVDLEGYPGEVAVEYLEKVEMICQKP